MAHGSLPSPVLRDVCQLALPAAGGVVMQLRPPGRADNFSERLIIRLESWGIFTAATSLCTYEPGAWHVAEDRKGVHVGRTGEHDPFPEPETPERINVRDNHSAALRELNARHAAFWKRQPTR
jgi:hypothetical protein